MDGAAVTTHDDIRKKLSGHIDGSLTQEEQDAVERHFEECQDCRDELTELRRTVDYVRTLEKVEPPPWLAGKIMARVRDEAPARKGMLPWLFYPLHIKVPLEALAVLLICFSGYFLATKTSKEEPALLSGAPPMMQTPAPPRPGPMPKTEDAAPAESPAPKREEISPTVVPEAVIQREAEEAQKARKAKKAQEYPAPVPPAAFAPAPPPPPPAAKAPPSLPAESAHPVLEPLPEVPQSLKSKRVFPLAKPAERSEDVAVMPGARAPSEAGTAMKKAAKAPVPAPIFVLHVPAPILAVSAVEEIVEKEKGRVLQVDMDGSEVVMHVITEPLGRDRIITALRSLGPIKEEQKAPQDTRRIVIRIVK